MESRREFLRRSGLAGLGFATAGLPGITWSVENDTLHIRNYADLTSLDPVSMLSGAEFLVGDAIHRRLVRFTAGEKFRWQLDAAEYFERLDDTHYAFRLHPGIEHDKGFGEMTAEDVKISLERIIDPAMNSPNAGDLGTLSHVDVHDRYSGTIVLKSPYAALIPIGLCAGVGAILSKKALESVGGQYRIEPPSCSGPYRFVSWQAQRKTVLERSPVWGGEPAAFREIHIYAMTDKKASELAYEAGELDCAQVSVESVEVFQRHMPPQSRLDIMGSLRYYWIGLNQDHPKLRDIRVRRAVQYAIDVGAVIEAAWFGLAKPATGIIAPSLIGHREKADIPPEGDRLKARELLREAGVELPLKLTLALNADSLEMTIGLVVQWSLKQVGIEVELQPQDNATYVTTGMESAGDRWQDLQIFLQSFSMLGDPYYATVWFTSKQVGIWNWERFSNAEFDRLHDVALALSDEQERDRIYQHMQHLMEDSGCYRFLAHGVEAMLSRLWMQPAYRADGFPIYRDFTLSGPDKT
ncbi:MAG TPA: ABC transporter substrate-binding protein [Xanthomonadales bacterium]